MDDRLKRISSKLTNTFGLMIREMFLNERVRFGAVWDILRPKYLRYSTSLLTVWNKHSRRQSGEYHKLRIADSENKSLLQIKIRVEAHNNQRTEGSENASQIVLDTAITSTNIELFSVLTAISLAHSQLT